MTGLQQAHNGFNVSVELYIIIATSRVVGGYRGEPQISIGVEISSRAGISAWHIAVRGETTATATPSAGQAQHQTASEKHFLRPQF